MGSAKKQAKTRKNIAYVFFFLGVINILMKILGISVLDASSVTTVAGATGIMIAYYSFPIILFCIGFVFISSSKSKLLEAEYED